MQWIKDKTLRKKILWSLLGCAVQLLFLVGFGYLMFSDGISWPL